ncbi:anthranilate synthase component I family protein [Paenibacillus sp. WLX1005]|uniref:anthranilate synthase component I family protein n=1 Tax=Paenibacillus sp. WLX1005 TaxID=3243766 RepID=UPI0039843486
MTRGCISLQQWQVWSEEGYNQLPYILRVPLSEQLLPESWEVLWSEQFPHTVLLENGKSGRYSYIGVQPVEYLSGDLTKGQSVILQQGDQEERQRSTSTAVVEPGDDPAYTPSPDQLIDKDIEYTGKPLDVLRQWMSRYRAPRVKDVPPFTGGIAGFLSYDVARSLERLPNRLSNELELPEYGWLRFDQVWVVDHQERLLYCCVHTPLLQKEDARAESTPAVGMNISGSTHSSSTDTTDSEAQQNQTHAAHNSNDASYTSIHLEHAYTEAASAADQMAAQWQQWLEQAAHIQSAASRQFFLEQHPPATADSRTDAYGFTTDFQQAEFEQAVCAVQHYIRQGDVFQVNLSLRSHRQIKSTPERIYEWLRLTNPSPYMGLLRLPGFQLVSASPELLVSVIDGSVSARPIAGTRRRGTTEQEDHDMEQELLHTEKERAEHIMLVDLQRNDLGRIARYGTVRVPELLTIERYSHVMHLVSGVQAELADNKDVYDVIAATFPGGTITGAPKIRTMEIIEELEHTRRGAYTGSMGWIDYNGNMELNIIIRTLTIQDRMTYMQAGAGIVIDSEPYREYRECFNKSRALARAVMLSEQYDQAKQQEEDIS